MKPRTRHKDRKYDLALSFAGEDRLFVQDVAEFLQAWGLRVFYDAWEQDRLVGVNLYEHFDDLYQNRARYCAIFISKFYVKKAWPRLELRAAEARAFLSRPAYILPVRLDQTNCPGIPKTIGFIRAKRSQPSEVAMVFLRRLRRYARKLGAAYHASVFPQRSCAGWARRSTDAGEYQFTRQMRWEISWDGSVQAKAHCKCVYLGGGSKRRLGFNVWSVGKRPLHIRDVWAHDEHGPLKVTNVAASDTSAQFQILLRSPLKYGESIHYTFGYRCDNYYQNVEERCTDNFTVSLPTRIWEYEFVFPRGSALKTFQLTRAVGRMKLREFHVARLERERPIVSFSCPSPKVGSSLSVEFSVRRVSKNP